MVTRRWIFKAGIALLFAALVTTTRSARAQTLDNENIGSRETASGNTVADAIRALAGTDLAFVPAAAFKPGASTDSPAKASTLLEPADDAIVVLNLRGEQVLDALERSVSFTPQKSSGFLQVSGLRFVYDANKPSGKRVVSATANGAPLEAVKTYKVATTKPLASGQQGYFQIWEPSQIASETGKTLADALATFAKASGVDGRIGAK